MRRLVKIERRCLAVVGMLALVLAYLPGLACVLKAAPACCTGTMCPMHNSSSAHMTCAMDMAHQKASLQSCGCHSVQYTGGMVFNRVVPAMGSTEVIAGPAPLLSQRVTASLKLDVVLPPPRFTLS